jgi:hypothetical protein
MAEMRDLKLNQLLWWHYKDTDKMLVRLRGYSKTFATCQVVAATALQVIRSGYGNGEIVNTMPQTLSPVVLSDSNG